MGEAAEILHMTHAQYVAFEMNSPDKHEFINGQVYAMTGGSAPHARIMANIGYALRDALKGRRCWSSIAEQRVQVEATGASLYPDVVVICGQYRFADEDADAVTNPTVIVEVLSPSTADYDRGAKFEHYQRIDDLQTYVLVHQTEPKITVYERQADEAWLMRNYTHGVVPLPTIEAQLAFAEVYDLEGLR